MFILFVYLQIIQFLYLNESVHKLTTVLLNTALVCVCGGGGGGCVQLSVYQKELLVSFRPSARVSMFNRLSGSDRTFLSNYPVRR